MDGDIGSGAGTPESPEAISVGESPFAEVNRTVVGKLAMGLSFVPWVTIGLMCILQPG